MTFEEILDQAIAMLQRRGRVTYRALARQFNLDEHFRGGKSMLQCTGIDHVALVTHDMEATVQFYTRLLGMRLVRTMRTGPALNNARHYFFDAGRGNQLAFFDAADSPPSVIPQHLHHLALTVDSVADLQAIHQRLREHGVEVTDILERAYGSTFYFHDPNGIHLQLAVQTRAWEGDAYADPDPVPSARQLQASQ